MFDLEPIFQFSRHHCVAICAFLVPANLATTIRTLLLVLLQRSAFQVRLSATLAIACALTLFLHVATWFVIGVITPVTFILATLGSTCIVINLGLAIYQTSVSELLLGWKKTIKNFAR